MHENTVEDMVRNAVRPIANKYGTRPVANALRNVADDFDSK